LFVTRYSDKQQKRLKFLFPLLIFITFFTMLLSFADSFLKWLIFLGLFNITYILIYPFFFAVVLDKIEDKSASMIIREAMLNTGRAVGILAALLIFYTTGSLQFTFLIIGISPLVYMLVLSRKKVYIDEAYDPLAPVVKVYNGSKQVVAKVYAWGKVVKVKEFALNNVVVKAFTGTKWKTVSLRNISKARLNRFLSGKTSVLFKRMRKTE